MNRTQFTPSVQFYKVVSMLASIDFTASPNCPQTRNVSWFTQMCKLCSLPYCLVQINLIFLIIFLY